MADDMSTEGHRILNALMRQAENMDPDDVFELASRLVGPLGLREVTVYLANIEQVDLVPTPNPRTTRQSVLPIDNSMAGWAYRTATMRMSRAEPTGLALWMPMVDGAERIGVLSIQCEQLDASTLAFCRSLALLLTLIVLAKSMHSDSYARLQRAEQMNLPAEMVWAFLPPRTLRTPEVISTAVLEPAYNLGGDAFDHSLVDHTLHAAIMDSMGHDLNAGLTTSVALAGARNARRNGFGLRTMTESIDQSFAEAFPGRHCTAIFTNLDLSTGELTWVNCGHPHPLLLRDQQLVDGALDRPEELPLGLGYLSGQVRTVHNQQLQPRDRVLFYTDGVIDARSQSGERFGMANFTDFILRATAAGEPIYEVLRRLIRAIMSHHSHQLTDDATILHFEWQPSSEEEPFPSRDLPIPPET